MFKTNIHHTVKHLQQLGSCNFIQWLGIDELLVAWANAYFGENSIVCALGEREGTSFYICLRKLADEDYPKFKALFDHYDKDGLYSPEGEFCVGDTNCLLPEEMSTLIIRELLAANTSLRDVGTVVAIEQGVFFMENALDWNATCV